MVAKVNLNNVRRRCVLYLDAFKFVYIWICFPVYKNEWCDALACWWSKHFAKCLELKRLFVFVSVFAVPMTLTWTTVLCWISRVFDWRRKLFSVAVSDRQGQKRQQSWTRGQDWIFKSWNWRKRRSRRLTDTQNGQEKDSDLSNYRRTKPTGKERHIFSSFFLLRSIRRTGKMRPKGFNPARMLSELSSWLITLHISRCVDLWRQRASRKKRGCRMWLSGSSILHLYL